MGRRVLVLNERDPRHPRAGGAEVHVHQTFRRLAARGWEVTQASVRHRGSRDVEELDGLRIRRLAPLPLYYPAVLRWCAAQTRRGRFDVVVECLNKLPFYAPLYAKAPVVAVAHHLFGEVAFQQVAWPIAATVWAAERALPVVYREVPFVSISESTRDDLIRRGIGPDHVSVSHCGVDPATREAPPLAARRRRIVYSGRLEPYKRVDLMLSAAARLVGRFPDLEVVVVGRGSDAARLEKLAHDLGIANRVRFTGFVDAEERDTWVAGSRVAVQTSPKEGWGISVIEANSLGTPVVASDAPGLRDSVRDGETGLLTPHGDIGALAACVDRLLGDDALFERQSRAALAWSRRFDWDRTADEMAAALEASS